jgi:hypothetical protein
MRRTPPLPLLITTFLSVFSIVEARAAISFVSGTNSATLSAVIEDGGEKVFIIDGIAEGESTTLTFSTDSTCPGVAMAGGAEFAAAFTCSGGVITTTIVDRGGLSFGPGPETGTFYVQFSDPPTPPGQSGSVAALAGIQLAVFGSISRWDLDGDITPSGATFGVELSGQEGGEAHFRMDLPQAAAEFLGGVLGVFIGGKPDPFATVANNQDGSVSIDVDIPKLTSSGSVVSSQASPALVTKKITAGKRALNVGFEKPVVKLGQSTIVKVCAGAEFKSGDKIPAKFTSGKRQLSVKKTFTLDSAGCGQSSLKVKSIPVGTLKVAVSYKGKRATGALKVTR